MIEHSWLFPERERRDGSKEIPKGTHGQSTDAPTMGNILNPYLRDWITELKDRGGEVFPA